AWPRDRACKSRLFTAEFLRGIYMVRIRMKDLIPTLLCVLLVAIFASTGARAQIDAGTVAGTVKDSSGAVIPDATITLKNDLTGISAVTRSASTGTYAFNGVNAGT